MVPTSVRVGGRMLAQAHDLARRHAADLDPAA